MDSRSAILNEACVIGSGSEEYPDDEVSFERLAFELSMQLSFRESFTRASRRTITVQDDGLE